MNLESASELQELKLALFNTESDLAGRRAHELKVSDTIFLLGSIAPMQLQRGVFPFEAAARAEIALAVPSASAEEMVDESCHSRPQPFLIDVRESIPTPAVAAKSFPSLRLFPSEERPWFRS